MQKLGLRFECEFKDEEGVRLVRYAITRADYARRSGLR